MAKLGWGWGSDGTLAVSKQCWGWEGQHGVEPVAESGWVGDSTVVSGRVKPAVTWECGQWPGWAWDQ